MKCVLCSPPPPPPPASFGYYKAWAELNYSYWEWRKRCFAPPPPPHTHTHHTQWKKNGKKGEKKGKKREKKKKRKKHTHIQKQHDDPGLKHSDFNLSRIETHGKTAEQLNCAPPPPPHTLSTAWVISICRQQKGLCPRFACYSRINSGKSAKQSVTCLSVTDSCEEKEKQSTSRLWYSTSLISASHR